MGSPHNRDMCVKYNAHINVECVTMHSVVKYLCKYVHKGHNRATIIFESCITHDNSEQPRNDRQRNEIQEYLDYRYAFDVESCWRIFEFNLQHQYPIVQKFQYHLPRDQLVVLEDRENVLNIVQT